MENMENLRDMEDLERTIAEKIIERLGLDVDLEDISHTAPLFASFAQVGDKSLGLDSLDGAELIVMLHEVWGITVQVEEMPNLTTIERIADFIRRKPTALKGEETEI